MIRIRNKLVVFESITMNSINPEDFRPYNKWLKKYINKKPFPKDNNYSCNDMIYDLCQSTGMLTLPDNINKETLTYMEDLLNELIS